MTQFLLAHVAGEQPTGLSLPDIVEQSLGEDPLAAPLAAALRRREANVTAPASEDSDHGNPGHPHEPDIADVLERLYEEVEALRARTRILADALGACPRCLGENDHCPVCHGRGHPGGRPPDGGLFTELVEPAWRRYIAELANKRNGHFERPSPTNIGGDPPCPTA